METELEIAGLRGGRVRLDPEVLGRLRAAVRNHVIEPGDPGWDDAVHVWNAMVSKRPALVLQPSTATEVAGAVAVAREQGILLSIKGGGHNIAGTALADGGLTLDMSRMNEVRVEPGSKLARVGAGCRLRDVDGSTQQNGLATALGFISKTGVAGLTLGGGFGYLSRRFGWVVDNLEEIEVVTADGHIRTVDRNRDTDLFWALRGGGGNFGVVTRFSFRLHQLGPMVTGGLMLWDARRSDEVLDAYRALTEAAPRELTAVAIIRLAPPAPFVPRPWHLAPVVAILVCHSGNEPERDLAPIRALGSPVAGGIQTMPYTALQSMLDDSEPDGLNQYWKTEYLSRLDDGYARTFREAALEVASPHSFSVIFHIAGALNERAADDGAVGNRDARFITGFSGAWPVGEAGAEIIANVRKGWKRIRPFSTGGNYVNFQLDDDDEARVAAAYGRNYDRLRRVKQAYDPDNLFRVNRNIPPAS